MPCCEDPRVYYANIIMHYRCATCGEMWHVKPTWLSENSNHQDGGYYYVVALEASTTTQAGER